MGRLEKLEQAIDQRFKKAREKLKKRKLVEVGFLYASDAKYVKKLAKKDGINIVITRLPGTDQRFLTLYCKAKDRKAVKKILKNS